MFDDYDHLAAKVLQPPLGTFLRSALWRYSAGHLGVLRLILYHLFLERERQSLQQDNEFIGYLLSEEFNVKLRALRIPYQKSKLKPMQIRSEEHTSELQSLMRNSYD